MRVFTISSTVILSVVFLTACGNDTDNALNAGEPAVAAELSPEAEYIEDQIAMLNRLADQLDGVYTTADAQKLKSDIAAEYVGVFGLNGNRAEQFDEHKLAQLLAKEGRLKRQMEAYKRVGLGMKRLSTENQDAYLIVAQEINKIYAAAR